MTMYFHKLSIISNKQHQLTSKCTNSRQFTVNKITKFGVQNNVNERQSAIPHGMQEIHLT
jgi:hypothetical protein